jgi:type I restriction enzyme R subunit
VSQNPYTEGVVEEALLEWLGGLGYEVRPGPEIAPAEPAAERDDYREVVLRGRLRAAVERLNPGVPAAALDEATRQLLRVESPSLVVANRRAHRMLVDGVQVEVPAEGGGVRGVRVRLVDFEDPTANDWLAVNQFTVMEGQAHRRPDVVVFVNGLPLAAVELKNPADEDATIWTAFKQLETYKLELPSFFALNELLVVSDGVDARLGSITSPREWFQPWRTIEGLGVAPARANRLEVLARGVFEKSRFLDLVRSFVVFEDDGARVAKKIAGYHQFHATRKAVETTVRAASPDGDRRAGVVWHTQGSGKSLTMAFYAGKLVLHPALENPTIVVLTDRNDLDDQLFGVFAACEDLLRQAPAQARGRAHLRELLQMASGGVVFTTIQKFLPEEKGDRFPLLSERRNVIVIADEAHRSQYDFIDGFARNMRDALPNATFVAFTGTPVELDDRDTRAVFGDYIDVYDIQRAVEDGATVPIYYESRLARLELAEDEKPHLDEDFEEITEGEEVDRKERLKSRWAQLEAIVGSEKRLTLVARDLVEHFERRLDAMEGKAMIVCMSRRICVDLYREIAKLRPAWHDEGDDQGAMKVVMTGSASDPTNWQPHIRSKSRREALARRFKDADDPFSIVIVRDMWLTGFDAPSLHTMYIDKPMRGHGLMQAIARVNRVFRDKPGGLVVDYLGLADDLRRALAVYAQSGGRGSAAVDQNEAVAAMRERYEICCDLFHGFDYTTFLTGTAAQRMSLLPAAQEHVLAQEHGRERFVKIVGELSRAFALAVPREEALAVRDEVAFFQTVKAALAKTTLGDARPEEDLDHAIRQIVSAAIAPRGVIDVFEAAGLTKPDIGLLSEEFLAEVREMPQRNLAVELLRRLLSDEVTVQKRTNLVQSRSFAQMLEAAIRRYQNRAIETAQVIEELIALAKEMREAARRGEELGLTDAEVAFYDALETNDSAVRVLGDETLRAIARELAETVRRNATIDWAAKESVKARLRALVRRTLRRYGYPPDMQEQATRTVLEQAELLGLEWAATDTVERAPFRVLPPEEARPYENCIPVYSLAVAAGAFSNTQDPEPQAWIAPAGRLRPAKGLFVAQVVGESMNRRIPNGALCVFRAPVEGSRSGRVVLVQHRSIDDPETGGSYTVKVYERAETGEVRLLPDSDRAEYAPITIGPEDADEMRVIAELVEVLPGDLDGMEARQPSCHTGLRRSDP